MKTSNLKMGVVSLGLFLAISANSAQAEEKMSTGARVGQGLASTVALGVAAVETFLGAQLLTYGNGVIGKGNGALISAYGASNLYRAGRNLGRAFEGKAALPYTNTGWATSKLGGGKRAVQIADGIELALVGGVSSAWANSWSMGPAVSTATAIRNIALSASIPGSIVGFAPHSASAK